MVTKLRNLVIPFVTVLAASAVVAESRAEAATTYPIVGTGDSILAMVDGVDILAPGGAILTPEAWINVEYGRQPYVAGMSGQASTASIWPLVLSRSRPGGWIIIQDNGIGTSNWAWQQLVQRIVDETPNDRCLLFIPPVFHPDFNAVESSLAAQRAGIMTTIAVQQPCRATIPWPAAVMADPSMVCDPGAAAQRGAAMPPDVENHQPSRCDGQHPSRRGQLWLQRALANAINVPGDDGPF